MNLTIYIDVLFLLNLILDYIILVTTVFLNGTKAVKPRMIIAAISGALYSVIIFFPTLSFLNMIIFRMLASAVIVAIAFEFKNLFNYIKNLLTYYIVNAVYGGGIYAFYNFTVLGSKMNYSNGVYYIDLPLWAVIVLAFVFYWLIKLFTKIFDGRITQKNIRKIEISFLSSKITVDALFDTGNSLCDPISLMPVMLVQTDRFKNKLGSSILNMIESNDSTFLPTLHSAYPELKFRVIPFKDITGNKTTIYAFKPTKITDVEKNKELGDMLVGLISTKLSEDMSYTALLNSRS